MSTLERAIAIAAEAHAGALDKGGHPYILHPLRIMMSLSTPDERITAVLHDVVEDSSWTIEQLRSEGFSEDVLRAVDALTKRDGEKYLDYVRRAGANPLARRVKRADLADNMNLSRLTSPSDQDNARIEKYESAVALLDAEYGEP